MAEKILKSITFPGSDDVYVIEPGIGKDTEYGGEIFNDYENNEAFGQYNHTEGMSNISGIKGFHMIEVDAENLLITVDDSQLTEKASVVYAIGDVLQFEAKNHYNFKMEIVSLVTNNSGQSVIGVKQTSVGEVFNLALDPDPAENYCWVLGKNYGEVFPMARSSHSEGESTMAAGRCSHAEGRKTKAAGNYSHAEGRETVASYRAHAEGYKSQALESDTHAEGYSTLAKGFASHSEGQFTKSLGYASHSEGSETQATGGYSHAEGKLAVAEGSSAHAEGYNTLAQKAQAHAEGSGSKAKGVASHSEGLGTTAEGDASHAEGGNTKATGSNAHSEGTSALAEGISSHAEGEQTHTIGSSSHTEGKLTVAKGTTSHAEGYQTLAEGSSSHAEGNSTKAVGSFSHTEGINTIAGDYLKDTNGNYLDADGNITTDSSKYIIDSEKYASHAEGSSTKATGLSSHAEGLETISEGMGSHSEGRKTKAIGPYSHAEGYSTIAESSCSHAEGHSTHAKGAYTHAEGLGTVATVYGQHTQGRYNEEDTGEKYAHIIGNGTSEANRRNIHTVDWNGNAWYAGKITAGVNPTEPMEVATKEYVDDAVSNSIDDALDYYTHSRYDAYLEFDGEDGLKDQLAGQATVMVSNDKNRRIVHLKDKTCSVLKYGTGIARLYRHKAADQDEFEQVAVDICSGEDRYCTALWLEGIWENWSLDKVLTSRDEITATTIKDKTYTTIPVYSNYGAPDITEPSDFNNIAAWRYMDNSTALELRSLPADTLAKKLEQYLRNYFYTEDEVDAKISNINGGGSAGMVREFQATGNGLVSGATGEWTYSNNDSKFYIITLRYNPTGEVGSSGKLFSVTVDYKAIANNSPTTFYATDSVGVTITKTVDSNGYFQSITFKIATANTVFSEICGYY